MPGRCEDAAHREQIPRFSSVELVQTESGRVLLLEHRQGHELLVTQNVHDDAAFRVFEVIVRGSRARRFRIPRSRGDGVLEVSQSFREVAGRDGFVVFSSGVDLRCALVRADDRAD